MLLVAAISYWLFRVWDKNTGDLNKQTSKGINWWVAIPLTIPILLLIAYFLIRKKPYRRTKIKLNDDDWPVRIEKRSSADYGEIHLVPLVNEIVRQLNKTLPPLPGQSQ